MTPDEQRAYIAVLAAEAKELHARAMNTRPTPEMPAGTAYELGIMAGSYYVAAEVLDERVAVLTRDLESRK